MSETLPGTLRVPVTKSAAMRYLMECVEHGYVHHISGRLPAAKLLGFVQKMDGRYGVLAPRGVRAYAREHGRAAARLVVFPVAAPAGGEWLYCLLATQGSGAIHEQERLLDARKPSERLAWPSHYEGVGWRAQYELVGRPVLSRRHGLVHRWTWIMAPTLYGHMDEWVQVAAGRVRSSGEKDAAYLVAAAEALRRMPGFHGVRAQKRALLKAANLPREAWTAFKLADIGPYVDKRLPVFGDGRTVEALLTAAAAAAGEP